MENTNDKTASIGADENFQALLTSALVQAKTVGAPDVASLEELIECIDEHSNARAEEVRREAVAEIEALHRRIAAETLRADQGWQRYDSAKRDRNALRAEKVTLAQRTAGGDAVNIPRTAEEIVAFIGSHFDYMKDMPNVEDTRYGLSVHDLQSAFRWWFGEDGEPVAEAAAQADDWQEEQPPTPQDEHMSRIRGAIARAWCYPSNKHKVMDERIVSCAALEVSRLFPAPTAQPTPPEQAGRCAPQDVDSIGNSDEKAHCDARQVAAPNSQPTPPDDEPMTGATAPGWVAGRATPLDRLTRYGFDGTLGGDFDENADGPYVKLEDVRAALLQLGEPADERAAFPEHMPRLGRDEHTYESPVDWDDGYVEGWNDCVDAARAALRQPGAPAKPLTRRDINFVKQPPGVIALTLAILWHDGAERPLYTRDDQIAWTGVDAGGHEKSVTVGQLREVLVAALGLPVGTKFGG